LAEGGVERRLAAILVADVAGYSRLMGKDEEGTLAQLTAHRAEHIEPCIADHRGRLVKTMGDGLLVEFASVVDAVQCAVAFQEGMAVRNAAAPEDTRIAFRIGVNLGDVIVQDGDLYGDGVNIAARLEGLADPEGICISEMVRYGIGSRLDLLFEDMGPQQVKNIGSPVQAYRIRLNPEANASDAMSEDAPPLPDKPSIAVLPFDNMSNDPDQEYFSDGITEDIITELSKISGLFVIARHSAFTYKGKSLTLRKVGQELGVRYVLEGSVRKAGSRLRITAQLIDVASDHHLWAERYDRDIEDIFAVQDEVARQVAGALTVALTPRERKRLAHAPTQNLEAYDLYLRARARSWPPTRGNIVSAQFAFARVIDLDPSFAGGYAGKSIAHSLAVSFGHSDDRDKDSKLAQELAEQAVALDGEFARSHSALGTAYTTVRRHEDAISAARRAIELQPGDADSYAFCARCLMFAGLGDEAAKMVRTALRLDPQYIEGPYLNLLGRALFLAGRYEDSIDAYERNRDRGGPSVSAASLGLFFWIAACGHAGKSEAAQNLVGELLKQHPNFSLTELRDHPGLLNVEELARLIEGLRKAGLTE